MVEGRPANVAILFSSAHDNQLVQVAHMVSMRQDYEFCCCFPQNAYTSHALESISNGIASRLLEMIKKVRIFFLLLALIQDEKPQTF